MKAHFFKALPLTIFLFLIFPFFSSGQAQTGEDTSMFVQVDESKELEMNQKVRKRMYPGGRDEEDLKIQSVLNKPTRKISPTVDESGETADHED